MRTSFFAILIVLFFSTNCFAKEWPTKPLRGFNVDAGYLLKEDFVKLKSWGVNLLRVLVNVDDQSRRCNMKADLSLYKENLDRLDSMISLAADNRIYIVPVLGSICGRNSDSLYFGVSNRLKLNHAISLWRHIAQKYSKNEYVIGYDLLNEPAPREGGGMFFLKLFTQRLDLLTH